MTVARLGYEIDSTGAVKAAGDLDKMAASAKKAEVGAAKTAAASDRLGGAMKVSAAHTANLGAQFNDIGVMLAAGQSPLQLAVQQGTQINQVMAQMGGGTQALRGLAAGFMSMLNPMSLATIGIIAGGAALVQWGMAAVTAGDNGEELADAMRDIEESTRGAKLELMAMQMGLEGASQAIVQQEINVLEEKRAKTVGLISALSRDVGAEARRLKVQYELQLKDLDEQLVTKRELLAEDQRATEELANQRYLLEQANMFREAQQRLRNEAGAKLAEMLALEEKINNEIGDGAAELLKAAGVDLSNIDDAARRAAALALAMGMAYNEAYALANVDFAPIGGGLTVDTPNLLPTKEELNGKKDKVATRRGGGGKPDTFASDLERLRESLRTEQEVIDEWKATQDAILADKRSMELLGIAGHNEAKLRLEQEYQDRLANLQTAGHEFTLTGVLDAGADMLGAMGAINKKALKAQAVFAAGSAWISTLQGAAKELEKGTFGFATAAAVITKGLAFVGAIKSAGSGSSTSAGAGVTATSGASQAQSQRAIIQVQGGRSSFMLDEVDYIIKEIQKASKDGVIIEGITA